MRAKFWIILIFLLPFSVCASDELARWPDLSTVKAVSGRPAVGQDVLDGSAAFVLQDESGNIGKPMSVAVPQYALYTDESGKLHRVIIIQAETAKGLEIYGALDIESGKRLVLAAPDVTLLGTTVPKK